MNNAYSDSGKTKLKINDNVVVISGSNKGKRGKVLKIDKIKGRIIVEGVNKRNKYLKPSQENPQGRMINLEFPINISNVMYFCDKCKKGIRIGVELKDKTKTRICRSCSKSIDK
jgi:large subunit ribosomal protein L24